MSFAGGFGRLEADMIVPLGPDLVEYLARGVRVEGYPMPRESVRLLAPVPNPGKIIAVGLNYRDHAAETGTPLPSEPLCSLSSPIP